MNGMPTDQMSRTDLEHEVKLLRRFNTSYEEVIKLVCEKVTVDEALQYNWYFRFNDEYYLHPHAQKSLVH